MSTSPAPFAACSGHSVDTLVECAIASRKSQYAEDLILLPSLLLAAAAPGVKHRQRPLFVEMGAFDGVAGSNTYLLEMCCGWEGALIEPNPENYAHLERSNRTGLMLNRGVCEHAGNFTISATGGVFAGVRESLDPRYKRKAVGEAVVQCDTLSHLLEGAARPLPRHITFFSLDVEGAEESVLRGVDLRRVGTLLWETARMPRTRRMRIEASLRDAGLVPTNLTIQENTAWTRAEHAMHVVQYPEHPKVRSRRDKLRAALRTAAAALRL